MRNEDRECSLSRITHRQITITLKERASLPSAHLCFITSRRKNSPFFIVKLAESTRSDSERASNIHKVSRRARSDQQCEEGEDMGHFAVLIDTAE